MNIRKVTSLVALVSFIVLLINSIVLYIAPQGRISYWAYWKLWGMSKTDWTNQHIIIGVLFLIAIFLHIYYNWKLIINYLKNKAKQIKVFTRDFNIALIVTLICVVGSYFTVPPFNWIIDFSESIKADAEVKYGSPPYGHAEMSSLQGFARRTGIDLPKSMKLLEKAGIKFEGEKQTIQEIASQNNMSPQQIYLIMKPAEQSSNVKTGSMPAEPASGLGKKTVEALSKEYNLNIETIMEGFANLKIDATADMQIKAIAEQNKMAPDEVYEIIKKIVDSSTTTKSGGKSADSTHDSGTPQGLGRMLLKDVCEKEGLDQAEVVKKLAAKGISAKPDEKIRQIADNAGLTPSELYEVIK